MRYQLTFLFFCLLLINLVKTQSNYIVDTGAKCEAYLGDPVDTPLCNNILVNPNSVYIPSDSTQSTIWDKINLILYLIKAQNVPGCLVSDNFINFCSFFFPECIELKNDLDETISLPVRTCRSNCESSMTQCQIPNTNDFNCTQIDPFEEGPTFPITSSIYDLSTFNGNSSYVVDCVDPISIIGDSNINIDTDCPLPLIYIGWNETTERDHLIEEGYYFVTNVSRCVIGCPVPLFKHSQWDNLFRLSDSLSVISFICSIYLILTYVILNKKWSHSDELLNCFIVSIFFVSLSGFIQAINGTEKTFCPEKGRSAVQSDNVCGASGIIFQFSTIYAILFWTLMSFELWWSIKFISKKINYTRYYLVGTSIISFVFTIVPAANYNIYYGKANVICWLRDGKYMNSCYWIPMAVCLTIATVFIGLVIYEIYKIIKSNGKSGFLQFQIKPILMIVLIYATFLYVFSYNFYIQDHMEGYLEKTAGFSLCLAASKVNGEDCHLDGPPIGSIAMFLFIVRSYGIFVFIIYGYSRKARTIYQESILFNNRFVSRLTSKSSKVTGTTDSGSVTNPQNSTDSHKKSRKNEISVDIYSGNSSGAIIDSDDEEEDEKDSNKLERIY